jgi:hypothetical protein
MVVKYPKNYSWLHSNLDIQMYLAKRTVKGAESVLFMSHYPLQVQRTVKGTESVLFMSHYPLQVQRTVKGTESVLFMSHYPLQVQRTVKGTESVLFMSHYPLQVPIMHYSFNWENVTAFYKHVIIHPATMPN